MKKKSLCLLLAFNCVLTGVAGWSLRSALGLDKKLEGKPEEKAEGKPAPASITKLKYTHHADTENVGDSATVVTKPGAKPGTFLTSTPKSGELIFDDEFDTLDFKKWKHELSLSGGGNWEFEMYNNNRTSSYVRDGILYIKPGLMSDFLGSEAAVESQTTLDIWGGAPADLCTDNFEYGCMRTAGAGGNYLNPIVSARLRTAEYFNFRYGKIEARIKVPKGDWLWPAFWMLPRHNEYGNWPASGEIDIMESRGNANYPIADGGGYESFGSTLHFGPAYKADAWAKSHEDYTMASGNLNQDFHTYGCIWGPDSIQTYIDDPSNVVLNVPTSDMWKLGNFPEPYSNPWKAGGSNAPFDKEYYIILNLAVGGTGGYFPDGVGGKPWSNTDSHAVNAFWNSKGQWLPTWDQDTDGGIGEGSALQVDYVKVWAE